MNIEMISSFITKINALNDYYVDNVKKFIKDTKGTIKVNKQIQAELLELSEKYKDNEIIDTSKICKIIEQNIKKCRSTIYKNFNLNNSKFGLDDLDSFVTKSTKILIYKNKLSDEAPIINLITIYESFLKNIIYCDLKDGVCEIINNEKIDFNKLLKLNFEEKNIKEVIYNEYCNQKLRGEKKKIDKIIELFKIDCNDCNDVIEAFKEIYYRRNMYVHGINKITADYLSLKEETKSEWIKDGKLVKSPKYFSRAKDTLYKVIMMIVIKKYLYSRNFEKEDLIKISNLIYKDFYIKMNWDVSKFCYVQLKKISNNKINNCDRSIFFVNYLVCLKKTNDPQLEKELLKWDVSNYETIYKIAKMVISNNYINVNELLKNILIDKEELQKSNNIKDTFNITFEDLGRWPLFQEYIKTKQYKQLKKELNK